jgi:flagellar protein FliO/FliZ
MFDLFGAEMPLAVRFFLAFLIVLGLIGAAAWAVRRFGSARLGGAVRGRQPRLAVIDYASVDARRRLILVRRDNVEHLMMIGGPTDVVVEANIVRAVPAARDVPLARPPAADPFPRAIPLPEIGNGSWPLQPDPAPPRRAPRAEPSLEESENSLPPHSEPPSSPPPRPQREVLTALADDLAAHPVPPIAPAAPAAPIPPRRVAPPPRPQAAEPRPEPRMPAQPVTTEPTSAADQSLADMAQRLEAALRKSKTQEPREANTSAEAEAAPSAPPTPAPPAPRPARAAEAKPARPDVKAKEGKLYDTLEQEMASLLGRPPGKT